MMPILPRSQELSDTSFLFESLHCLCHAPRMEDNNAIPQFCPICKKRSPNPNSRPGSFTAFLFSATRCQCGKSARAAGPIATKLEPSKEHGLTSIIRPSPLERERQRTRIANRTQALVANSRARAMISVSPGETIGGTYHLDTQIGQGGMGLVFKATHTVLNRPCAVKFLLPELVTERSWQMFKNEAKILNSLDHQSICKIYDLGLHQKALPFLSMELIEGITLEDYLTRHGPLSTGAAFQLIAQAARTLAYAHRHNIIHRDLKPANIMIYSRSNGDASIKILDFGISQTINQGEMTEKDREIVGSAYYMSPEQFRGDELSPASDIYSLGCTLFECLTGRPPYVEEAYDDLSEMHQSADVPSIFAVTDIKVSPQLEAILAHCLQKHPLKRYKNMSELAVDCEKLILERPLQFAHVESSNHDEERTDAPTANKAALVIIALMVLVCGTLVAGYFGMSAKQPVPKVASSKPITDSMVLANNAYMIEAKPADGPSISREEAVVELTSFISQKSVLGAPKVVQGKKVWAFDFPRRLQVAKLTWAGDDGVQVSHSSTEVTTVPQDRMIAVEISQCSAERSRALLQRLNPDCVLSLFLFTVDLEDPKLLSRFKKMQALSLHTVQLTDKLLETIGAMRQLQTLFLRGGSASGEKLAKMLEGHPYTYLHLDDIKIEGGLAAILPTILANKKLVTLEISLPEDKHLIDKIAKCSNIRAVRFETDIIGRQQVESIVKALPDKRVEISYISPRYEFEDLHSLERKYPTLHVSTRSQAPTSHMVQ